MDRQISRRNLFAAGGAGAIIAANLTSFAGEVEAASAMGPGEKANLKVVKAFCKSWGSKNPDPDTDMPKYLTAPCSARVLNDGPFLTSPGVVAEVFKKYTAGGACFEVRFLGTWTQGHVVVTHRIDTMIAPGKPDQEFEVVGIFVMKDGKIEKWDDFTISPA